MEIVSLNRNPGFFPLFGFLGRSFVFHQLAARFFLRRAPLWWFPPLFFFSGVSRVIVDLFLRVVNNASLFLYPDTGTTFSSPLVFAPCRTTSSLPTPPPPLFSSQWILIQLPVVSVRKYGPSAPPPLGTVIPFMRLSRLFRQFFPCVGSRFADALFFFWRLFSLPSSMRGPPFFPDFGPAPFFQFESKLKPPLFLENRKVFLLTGRSSFFSSDAMGGFPWFPFAGRFFSKPLHNICKPHFFP